MALEAHERQEIKDLWLEYRAHGTRLGDHSLKIAMLTRDTAELRESVAVNHGKVLEKLNKVERDLNGIGIMVRETKVKRSMLIRLAGFIRSWVMPGLTAAFMAYVAYVQAFGPIGG